MQKHRDFAAWDRVAFYHRHGRVIDSSCGSCETSPCDHGVAGGVDLTNFLNVEMLRLQVRTNDRSYLANMRKFILVIVGVALIAGCANKGVVQKRGWSELPADFKQSAAPEWVEFNAVTPSDSKFPPQFGVTESVDLHSMNSAFGWIWVWDRAIYDIRLEAIGWSVAETYRGIDCSSKSTTEWNHHFRKGDGTLVRDGPVNEYWERTRVRTWGKTDPRSKEIVLVCARAGEVSQ